jgi:hypothetical protein
MDAILNAAMKIAAVIGSLGVPAVLLAHLNRKRKEGEEMKQARREETVLILEGIMNIGELSYATAVAVREGECNGCMEDAMRGYKAYSPKLQEFLRTRSVKSTH